MTGYAFATAACFGCGRMFSFNPVRVPSIRDPKTGEKEPVCLHCIERANPRRIANGLPPIVPHPEAYEPCSEEEM